ncbi:right-handed parallel beta-helix repeat-containing protein [Paenibacillus sp. J5C_2022]|uniref:right-handed parallel beta-helix repeat-containing protein n=1 Tax=Paenibacillus sp. J5C2022 TaxID=2977129 RepID=UPI0021D2281B|nr:right-handed parallel beta-helix repeat-containing protein [Paenibacillus sp. J5C2022]MCU6710807.1 right-handed parallel beta-helix repeat-containing protein [Paenibacillus sp. J5C2022]
MAAHPAHRKYTSVPAYAKAGFIIMMSLMILLSYTPLSAYSTSQYPRATYYVAVDGDDHAAGTIEAPWRTIQHAVDSLAPGDTVMVRGGIYEELVNIVTSGMKGAYMIIQAYPGERPVIDGTGLSISSGSNALISLKGSSYVVIDGFELRGLATSSSSETPAGIRVRRGGSHIHILNNDVHHIENRSDDGNAHGIHIFGNDAVPLTDIRVSGNRVHHLKLGSSESLTISGNVDGFSIDNNTVHDNNNIGIDIAGFYGACSSPCRDQARNGAVWSNTVYNIDSSTNPAYRSGSRSAGGIYADGAANIVIERNEVFGSNFGIEIASENEGRTTSGITVRNNYVHHNDGAGILLGGSDEDNGGASHNVVANNTLLFNDTYKQGYGAITFQENNVDNVVVNNLIYAEPGQKLVHKYGFTGSGNVVDYNLYYRSDGVDAAGWQWERQSYSTWEEFREVTGFDEHSIFADPKLAAPNQGDIALSSHSPAIDSGTNAYIGSGTLDLFGAARLQGEAADIGALEYGGTIPPPVPEPTPQPSSPPEPTLSPTTQPSPEPSVDPGGGVEPVPSAEPTPTVPPAEEGFTVDGHAGEWESIPTAAESNSNVRTLQAVLSNGKLYIMVTGSLLGDKGQLYMNTDNNADTGFQTPFWSGSGADYLLENGILYRYSGSGGTDWDWSRILSYKELGQHVATSTTVEAALSLEHMEAVESDIGIGYVWKDSMDDRLPLGRSLLTVSGEGGGAIPTIPPVQEPSIDIDGSGDDWMHVPPLDEGAGNPQLLKAYHDEEYLYLLIEGSGLQTKKTQVFLDTDAMADTGYLASGWSSGGAEYMLEYGRLYRYDGEGQDWSWVQVSNLKRKSAYHEQDVRIEAAISLQELGSQAGSNLALGVVLDDDESTQLPASGEMLHYPLN